MTDWIDAINSIKVSIIPIISIILSAIALYLSYRARQFEIKEKRRIKISQDLKMYFDIAYSNYWNWLPNDVGINDPRYFKYMEAVQRFIYYLEFVDPKIQDTHRYVANKFTSGYKQNEKDEIWKKYQEVRDFSINRAIELGKQLRNYK